MFFKLWKRWVVGSGNKNVRRNRRLKPPRVAPSLEWLEKRELLSTATPNFIIEPTQQTAVDPASAGHSASPPPGSSPTGFSPSQIQNAYGFNQIGFASYSGSTLPGAGQTIAIVDAYNDPDIYSNLETFDAQYGLVNPTLTVVNQSGQVISTNGNTTGGVTPPSNNSSWAVEESLDVEWAHAIAPGANIVLVEASNSNMSSLLTAVTTASTNFGASVVSMSWGGSESASETSDDSYFDTPGVTYVAASGDSGAPPIYPATSPNVLAVGGTSLTLNSSGGYGSETAWSDSGGGISSDEARPSYQPSTYSNGSTTDTSTKRMSPDVSYDANPDTGFAVYDTDGESGWLEVGGTSDAAPQWAALVAIADQGRVQDGEGTLSGASQTLPMIYQMPSSDFHDITSGSNGTYSAGTGYDLLTGRGTPIANDVIAYLVNPTSSPPSPPSPPSTPTAPTGLKATAESSSEINLSWNSDSGATDGFLIYRSTSSTSGFSEIGSAASGATTFSSTGLSAVTTYYYEVFAVNAYGDSGASTVSATTPQSPSPPSTPTAPTGLKATAESSSEINLSWNSDSGATDGFLIYRSTSSTSGFSEIGSAASGATTFSSTGLSADTTYYYEVFAVNAYGDSGASTVSATTPQSPSPAPPPSGSGQLLDGNFTSSSVPSSGNYVIDPTGTPWTFQSTAGIASNTSILTRDNPTAPSSDVGFLSGRGSAFSQTVALSTGNLYTLTFDAAQAGIALPYAQQFEVVVGGTVLGVGTPPSSQYTSYSTVSFYVTVSGNYSISFIGTNSSGGIALLDNIALGVTPMAQQGRSDSAGSAMVSLSGSPVLSSNPISVGTTSPSTGGQASVPTSQVPTPSTPLPLPNSNLGLLTNPPSATNLPLIDQLFIEIEQYFIAEFNSLLSLSDFSALVTSLRSQT